MSMHSLQRNWRNFFQPMRLVQLVKLIILLICALKRLHFQPQKISLSLIIVFLTNRNKITVCIASRWTKQHKANVSINHFRLWIFCASCKYIMLSVQQIKVKKSPIFINSSMKWSLKLHTFLRNGLQMIWIYWITRCSTCPIVQEVCTVSKTICEKGAQKVYSSEEKKRCQLDSNPVIRAMKTCKFGALTTIPWTTTMKEHV